MMTDHGAPCTKQSARGSVRRYFRRRLRSHATINEFWLVHFGAGLQSIERIVAADGRQPLLSLAAPLERLWLETDDTESFRALCVAAADHARNPTAASRKLSHTEPCSIWWQGAR